jgi:hypothetical protein
VGDAEGGRSRVAGEAWAGRVAPPSLSSLQAVIARMSPTTTTSGGAGRRGIPPVNLARGRCAMLVG